MGNDTTAVNLVIITGASKGIGKAIATAFAGEGCTILICSRSAQNLQKAVSDIKSIHSGAIIKSFAADFSKKEEVI